MVKEPKISVLMPVYNCIQYIRYSIESILSQTFDNFEFIIIDASDDETSEIINSYDDDRIVYFKKKYLGLSDSLNFAIERSKSKYLARMDADDISDKHRLEIQYNLMQRTSAIDILGTNFYYIDEFGRILFEKIMPERNSNIEFIMPIKAAILHPSIMMKKEIFELNKGYSTEYLVEDVELFLRLLTEGYRFYNIQKPLYLYRYTNKSIGKIAIQKNNMLLLGYSYLGNYYVNNSAKKEKDYRIALLEYYNGNLDVSRKYFFNILKSKPFRNIKILRYLVVSTLGKKYLKKLRDNYVFANLNKYIAKYFFYDTNAIKRLEK